MQLVVGRLTAVSGAQAVVVDRCIVDEAAEPVAKRAGSGHTSKAVWGYGLIIAAVVAVWIAMTVAWGWTAGMTFGFLGAIALVRMAGAVLGGTLIQQAGRGYYERQLRGRRRAP